MTSGQPAKNFWLWGTWGKRKITAPFLTQKVVGKIRDVVIGQSFIIALEESGTLVSWGEDKVGCLGLGNDRVNQPEPAPIPFPMVDEQSVKVVDVQFGRHHVMALTDKGKVYTWGENSGGQLGLGDLQTRFEPALVEELNAYTVTQVVAVDNMSYALTAHGVVYAWGENKEGTLGLEHDSPKVPRPEPMMRMREQGTHVKKLLVKDCGTTNGKTSKVVIACVEMAEPRSFKDLPGGFARPLGELSAEAREKALSKEQEREIFEGVDLMRKVMDKVLDMWKHVLSIRHGSPYEDGDGGQDEDQFGDNSSATDNCTALQLDRFVELEELRSAEMEMAFLIDESSNQIREIKSKEKGTKNILCVLSVFVDMCRLRREKIRSTISTRELLDHKRGIDGTIVVNDFVNNKAEEKKKLRDANERLISAMSKVRKQEVPNFFAKALQDSIAECIECKLQVHATQMEHLKSVSNEPSDTIKPALQVIKERWISLRNVSVYRMYQEFQRGGPKKFGSDEELLTFLCQSSDSKIDHIIQVDRDRLISRDLLVPALCYDLLLENAELRKMCNAYQLRVLLMRSDQKKGRH
eukprot:CAMPEP_0177299616 /NCGR_PEP_ID=MMETSP0368-20130122/4123_1 /TAXON_ID=447022 ORGANISM="Scrippsiella hangoei-like, Strain SHHI-4" /NCGR_SAMPLE_ID=MMETSP0368 /ASSEMBLY_ACC=CAM_ASM_000363 /LENGTH=578 /DNA_ID=CAMNT_0018757965 /DNA_START=52 /DNA_END=1789 /DNA_ORIENTATION=-